MLGHRLALTAGGQLGKVLACAEHLARARNDDCADRLVLFGVVHDVFHCVARHAIEGVRDLRAIDANDEQAAFTQVGNDGIGAIVVSHSSLLCKR